MVKWNHFEKYVAMGKVPIRELYVYRLGWSLLMDASTYRNGRRSHEYIVEDKEKALYEKFTDKDTGEMSLYKYFDE